MAGLVQPYLVFAAVAVAALAVALPLAATDPGIAQTRVRTETVRRSLPPPPPAADAGGPAVTGTVPVVQPRDRATPAGPLPEIERDLARLPPAVARMRDDILAAARSGDLHAMRAVMQAGKAMPIFSLDENKNPIATWRATFPDSGGIEILSIVVAILEAGYIHVDAGTPQEMYLWPYFARVPLKALSPAQRVELFRIVTGPEYKEMRERGTYDFYRLGIGPDGTWHFLVAGD